MPKKPMPVAERQRETEDGHSAPPPRSSHNRPDIGASQAPSPAVGVLTWAGGPVKSAVWGVITEGQVGRYGKFAGRCRCWA